jgi:hypothetical protein
MADGMDDEAAIAFALMLGYAPYEFRPGGWYVDNSEPAHPVESAHFKKCGSYFFPNKVALCRALVLWHQKEHA